jgi:uncharacterized membrane protein YgcG
VISRSMTAGAALLVCGASLAGCHPVVKKGAGDKWLAATVQDAAIRNGILTQQMLYPYHFVENSAELNELGAMDLAVLADHYRLYPGDLGIRRGHTRAELYDARVKAVREGLAMAGVDTSRMKLLADSLQGGEGMASERVIHVLENSYEDSGRGGGRSGGRESQSSGDGAPRSGSGGSSGGSGGSSGSQRTGGR